MLATYDVRACRARRQMALRTSGATSSRDRRQLGQLGVCRPANLYAIIHLTRCPAIAYVCLVVSRRAIVIADERTAADRRRYGNRPGIFERFELRGAPRAPETRWVRGSLARESVDVNLCFVQK